MLVFTARNVNDAYNDILWRLGITEFVEKVNSRNGGVMRFKTPVTTVYEQPLERVLWDPVRDANPFFHIMEVAWMLAGRNDVEWVAGFAKQMREYTDNGTEYHGAYGHRWRKHFKFDQLSWLIDHLGRNPSSRRAVLSMWDAEADPYMVEKGGKDVPCNTQAYFTLRSGALDMFVTNRSNDIIWGAYGANAVHFSYLLEYLASGIGVRVGRYWQVSNDFHIYEQHWPLIGGRPMSGEDLYSPTVYHLPLLDKGSHKKFTNDLRMWMGDPEVTPETDFPFIRDLLYPVYMTWQLRKSDAEAAKWWLEQIKDPAWKLACARWLLRRIK
jgi:thymidylate synthase